MRIARLNEMEQYILKHRTLSLEQLSQHFDISMSTVRRDIAILSRHGNVEKIYGGIAVGESSVTVAPMEKIDLGFCSCSEGSQLIIGRLAASLVQDGMSIFLDSGAAMLHLLPNLKGKSVTVISHSIKALYEAAKYPSMNVIALGGIYDPATASFVGAEISEKLSKMSIDIVFLGADGVTLERGLTSANYAEAAIKKSVVQWNKNLVLVTKSATFGYDALLTFCDFDNLSVIVTDNVLPEKYRTTKLHYDI